MPCTTATARRALQPMLGQFGVFACESGTTTTAVITAAFQSTLLDPTYLQNAYVFSPVSTIPKVRRIASINPIAGVGGGSITFDGPLGTAVTQNTILEISTRVPATRQQDALDSLGVIAGALECLNEALRHLLVPATRLLTLVSGQTDYLLPFDFLNRGSRLDQVWVPNVVGPNTHLTEHRPTLMPTVGGNVLHFDAPFRFSGAYQAQINTLQPADSFIDTGGGYADSAVGLVGESDTCWPEVNDLVQVALVYAYRTLMSTRNGSDRAYYTALYANQVNEARKVYGYDHSNDVDSSVPVGPSAPTPAPKAVAA